MRPLHPLRKVVLILYLQIRKKFRFGGPTLRDGDSVDLEWGAGICILTSLQVILTWGLWPTLWDMLHNPRAVVPGDTSHALLISGHPTRPASTLVMSAKCPCPDFTEEFYHPVPLHHSDTDPRQTEPKLMISLWLFLWERKLCWQTAGVLSCKIERIPLESENNLKNFLPPTFFFFLEECSELLKFQIKGKPHILFKIEIFLENYASNTCMRAIVKTSNHTNKDRIKSWDPDSHGSQRSPVPTLWCIFLQSLLLALFYAFHSSSSLPPFLPSLSKWDHTVHILPQIALSLW